MSGNLRLRLAWVAATVLLLSYFAAANCFSEQTRLASPLIPDAGIRLGLDLQGGIHWVVGVQARRRRRSTSSSSSAARCVEQLDGGRRRPPKPSASSTGACASRRPAGGGPPRCATWAKERGAAHAGRRAPDGALEYTLSERWKKEVRERGMAQVLEVLRRRIEDPIQGIPDSVVTRQGDDRILVQIPGGQIDRARAREMLQGHRLPRVQDRARDRRRPRSCCARSTRTGCRPTPRSPSSATRRRSACSRPSWSGTRPISPATIWRTRASASTSASARS